MNDALPNPARGETAIELAGQRHILRPTFSALVAAEVELGSLFAMVERAAEGSLTITEIAGLLWHCIPVDARPDRESFSEAVLQIGLVKAAEPTRAIFSQILKGSA